jgi:hypothetical protein
MENNTEQLMVSENLNNTNLENSEMPNEMVKKEFERAKYVREKIQEEDEWRKLNPTIPSENNALREIQN